MTGSLESQNYEAHDCTLLAKLAADCLDWVSLNQLQTNLFENDGTWNRELEMNLKTKTIGYKQDLTDSSNYNHAYLWTEVQYYCYS